MKIVNKTLTIFTALVFSAMLGACGLKEDPCKARIESEYGKPYTDQEKRTQEIMAKEFKRQGLC